MGGRLALYVGLHKPHLVQSLILESASPGLASAAERRMRREQDESLAKRIETNGVAAFVDDWERLPLFDSQKNLPADVRNALRRRRLQNTADGLATSLRGMGTGVQPSLWANLPELRVRTLLLAGEYDHKFTTINQRMAEKIPNARLIIINGTGHSIHLEQPDIFLTVVQEFLAQPQPHWQDLSGTEQQDKDQSRQRHLLEPGV
jgi:2-succinyl-6-hydroxy-2,4-cyclohexadiene-1-carboxylate synthase